MNNTSNSTTPPSTALSIPISHSLRFWYFLWCDILSLACSFLTLYFLLSDRALRRALNNHIYIVLLCIGLLYELLNISWILHNNAYGTPWQASSSFYLFWVFFDYGVYSLQIGLFAWATIERHVLIFHERWVATKIKRLFVHYLPIVILFVYYIAFYAGIYYAIPCDRPFDYFLAGGVYTPCSFDRTLIGNWDLIANQIIPTSIMVISSLALIARVIRQKIRAHRVVQWKKYRKMTIQLVSVSVIYVAFNSPWVLLILAYQFGLPLNIFLSVIVYTKFLLYNITFLFPFVCCVSLSELRRKFKKLFLFWRHRHRVHMAVRQIHLLRAL